MSSSTSKRTAFLPLLSRMYPVVLRGCKKLKIFNPIVGLNAVDMMHMFRMFKFSADVILHNLSVFKHSPLWRNPKTYVSLRSFCPATSPLPMIVTRLGHFQRRMITGLTTVLSSAVYGFEVSTTYQTAFWLKVTIMTCLAFLKTKLVVSVPIKRSTRMRAEHFGRAFIIIATPITVSSIYLRHYKEYNTCIS